MKDYFIGYECGYYLERRNNRTILGEKPLGE
jgi:hypothetical protein